MSKKTPEQKYQKKKRELNIGLANNAFGAAAGAGAVKLAYDQAKRVDPAQNMLIKPDPLAKPKYSKIGQGLRKLKIKPKHAAIGAGIGIVGTQLANAAMDAQSGYYFGRERAKLKKPDSMVKKSYTRQGLVDIYESPRSRQSGIGYNLNAIDIEEIAKRTPRGNEREEARLRRVDRNEKLGYIGAGAGGTSGLHLLGTSFDTRQLAAADKPKNLGQRLSHAALKPTSRTDQKLKGMGKYRPRGRFVGGVALAGAAPAAVYLNRKAAERGRQGWS